MQQKFFVGQVVYLFVSQDQKILPVQIVEEVIRTTLNSSKKSIVHYCIFPLSDKKWELNAKKQKVFTSLEEAKEFLHENARQAIEDICSEAQALAKKSFFKEDENLKSSLQEEMTASETEKPEEYDYVDVQLPDKTIVKARINIPEKI